VQTAQRRSQKSVSASVAEWLQFLLGQRKDRGSNPGSAICLEYVIELLSWADVAQYGLFVLKVPLNNNQPTSQKSEIMAVNNKDR